MGKMSLKINFIMERIIDAIMNICSVLLLFMTVVTFAQVFMRFIFSRPFSWSEEVTLMMLVWFGYLAMSVDIYHDSHAALFFIYKKLPSVIRKTLDIFRQSILMVFFGLLVKYGLTITAINIPKLQPATRITRSILYMPLVVVGTLMFIFCLYQLIKYVTKPIENYDREYHGEVSIEEKARERGGSE